MKILFYFGHPAQYLFLRETIKRLIKAKHKVIILIKTKDVLEDLLKKDGLPYTNILTEKRGKSKLAIAVSLIKRNLAILPILRKEKPDLLIGTDATIAQLGWLLRINRITITEDDYDVIKTLAKLTYPFTQTILCPTVCNVDKWENKKIGYEGYMKLGYLHPSVFKLDPAIKKKYNFKEDYVLIRLAQLTAHHDFGIAGISSNLLDELIILFEKYNYQVCISAEGETEERYTPYLLTIEPNDMHQVLANASTLVCDSQSMSVEAAMLGVPSIRYSSFAGKISVLEELEHTYKLTFGIQPGNDDIVIAKINELLSSDNLAEEFQKRRLLMLKDKIDVSAFLNWFIENYPSSKNQLSEDSSFKNRFKTTEEILNSVGK